MQTRSTGGLSPPLAQLPHSQVSGQRCRLNAIDNAAWTVGEWWSTLQSEAGPKFERGYWSAIYVRRVTIGRSAC
jgi:hypothetical protein